MEVIIALLMLIAAVACPFLFIKYKKEKQKCASLNEDVNTANDKITYLSTKLSDADLTIQTLKKYEPIVDIENYVRTTRDACDNDVSIKLENARKEAAAITNKAKVERESAQQQSEKIIHTANLESEQIKSSAKEEAKQLRDSAREFKAKANLTLQEAQARSDSIIDTAHHNSTIIINNANEEAKKIAGDALEAKANADRYESFLKAIKNQIDGYGDEWLIPNRNLLDEIATQYEFKDAGEQLSRARELTRTLIRTEKAAVCDYVENHRKTTAIAFVLDAYNGKVDTILTKVKHNNYGKLLQEISDALRLVNQHGVAFRNARITDTYHRSRVNELKWAVAVNEIILEEKEEQKQIREQLREEERARKEYEKAIKEAEKEEKKLKEMMDKVRAELGHANEQERLKLESKIADLQQKYDEAEAKNQRALSMAQQTRAGHVYVISNIGSFGEDVFKIGMTRRLEPTERVYELGDASVPFSFDIHAMIFSEDAPALENELHKRFSETQLNLVNPRKEFFRVPLKDIKSVVAEMGMEAHWTLKAEAAQYRESLAIREGKAHLVSVA